MCRERVGDLLPRLLEDAMIRRDHAAGWILISQVEHARLAAEMAEAWGNERVPDLPERELLLPAIRDHDEGWRDWERLPDIEPENHWPRNFTEMPPSEATRIWTRSIETCRRGRRSIVDSVDEFRRFLAGSGMRLTHERAILAEEVFSSWAPFTADGLLERLPERDDGRRVSRASVYRTLALMEDAGLLRKASLGTVGDAFEQTRQIGAGSTLGGIWVSKHFRFLANRALESDSYSPSENKIFKDFIEMQRPIRESAHNEAMQNYGPIGADEVIETGFRWVQFFDLLSLWLCSSERTETEAFETPTGGKMHFTPLPSGEIAIEPYPFAAPELELEVDAKRMDVKAFLSRAAFQAEFDKAPSERLIWNLVRW